jgi:hypothetical protein
LICFYTLILICFLHVTHVSPKETPYIDEKRWLHKS